MNLKRLLKDGTVLLSLPPEELAAAVLRVLREVDDEERERRDRPVNISLSTFCNGDAAQYQDVPQEQCARAISAAFQHLINTGMLAPNPQHGPYGWFFVTERGRQIKTPKDYERYKHASRYPRGSVHPEIEELTLPEFLRGDYETAVFKAFKAVEDRVRTACGYDASRIGVPMMRKAFNPQDGPLTDQTEEEGERDALMHLFAAAIGRFKNSTSHRFTGLDDPIVAIEIIQLASLLLRIADQRSHAKKSPDSPGAG